MRFRCRGTFCIRGGSSPSDAGVGNWSSSDKSRDVRARSRCPGREPRAAGAERSDAPGRRRAHAHAAGLTRDYQSYTLPTDSAEDPGGGARCPGRQLACGTGRRRRVAAGRWRHAGGRRRVRGRLDARAVRRAVRSRRDVPRIADDAGRPVHDGGVGTESSRLAGSHARRRRRRDRPGACRLRGGQRGRVYRGPPLDDRARVSLSICPPATMSSSPCTLEDESGGGLVGRPAARSAAAPPRPADRMRRRRRRRRRPIR